MSNEFLDRMKKIGDEHGKSGGSGWVTQISFEFGFYAYGGQDHDRLSFWKRCESEEEAPIIKAEIQARLDKQKINEEPDFCLRVFCDRNVFGQDAYDWDRNEFYAKWTWDKKDDKVETCFTLIMESILKNNLPFGEKFWGKYQLKANPYHVAQGEAGKKPSKKDPTKLFFPTFALPTEKFVNEQAARDAVGSSGSSATNSTSGQYSDTVYENYDSESAFELNFEHIKAYYKMMTEENVKPFDTAPDFSGPWIEPKIKQYLAKMYVCETPDIDLVLLSDIPPF